ncbi:YibE/F family protein [Streptomyces triticirhizae]|uniref:YibE/F family protein n=1 Tax=Streptomyces triticirhizae TaxID=2483353 RepID=A0A3M2LZG0_9ACTN|nr:YibE/F family protein [Streptomyces triticirhizae]RMI41445.1 YibE/F family protein [Streptomyces triticirhizae]
MNRGPGRLGDDRTVTSPQDPARDPAWNRAPNPARDPSQDPLDPHAHPHGHTHQHGPVPPVSDHLRRVIAAVLVPFGVAMALGLVLLWPGGAPEQQERTGVGFDQQHEEASVTELTEHPCEDLGVQVQRGVSGPCEQATVEVTSGPHVGHTFTEVVPPDATKRFHEGQKVVVAYAPEAPEELRYSVVDVDREVPMLLLGALFALVVVAVGRLRGLLALVGLVASFLVLTLFILPAVLHGSNPLLVAVIGGSVIMLVTLYLCHGVNARTSVAVLGTLVSLLLIGLLGSLFIGLAHLTGNTDDQTGLVHSLYPDIEIRGLLLASILIGSLGVLDDVTVTQTSAVWELKQAAPTAGWRKLYSAAMRIGRDHIASVVNTLVLAYAGAALPLLLLFSIARSGVTTVAFSELVAEEIVRTLVGSIGLVASVPVTTLLAALVVSADRPPQGPAGGRGARAGNGPFGAGTSTGGTGASTGGPVPRARGRGWGARQGRRRATNPRRRRKR